MTPKSTAIATITLSTLLSGISLAHADENSDLAMTESSIESSVKSASEHREDIIGELFERGIISEATIKTLSEEGFFNEAETNGMRETGGWPSLD